MYNIKDIKATIRVGSLVARFLQNTERYLQAIKLCKECLVLLSNIALGTEDQFTKLWYCNIYVVMCNAHFSISDYTNAEKHARKLLPIFRDSGDKEQEGALSLWLAEIYYRQSRFVEAKELYESAIKLMKAIGERKAEAMAYGKLGAVSSLLCKYQKAKEYLEKGLAIRIDIGDRRGEGVAYNSLGCVFDSLGEYKKAKEYFEKELAITMELGDRKGKGITYSNLGNVFHSLGEYKKAKEYQKKALSIKMEIGYRQGEGVAYGNLGKVFSSLGEYKRAKEYHEKALAITMEIGDRKGEGRAYNNLGDVFYSLGEYKKTKEYFEKALAITIDIGDRHGEGVVYGSLGGVFYSLGEYQKAKEYFEKAFAITIDIGDRRGEGVVYGSLGGVFYSLGEYEKAKEYFEKALAITIDIGDRRGEGRVYGSLGRVFCSLGEYKKAKEHHDKALAISMEIGNRQGEAADYDNLGSVFYALGDYKKAKEYHDKALAITVEICYREREAACYRKLGNVYRSLGEYDVAEEYLEKARSISSDTGNTMDEFQTLCSFSQLKLSQSKLQEAFSYLYQCIEKYEKLRNFLQGNDQFKISLLEVHGTFPYKLLSRMLCHTRNFRDALYVEELGRARVLADCMAGKFSLENHISVNPESWRFDIGKIVNKESNRAFLYISYYARDVFLWLLKRNGDIFFRKARVDEDTLRAELVVDLEGVFQKRFRSFGILPKQICEDRSLSETMPISLHDESEAPLRGEETQNTERSLQLCSKLLIAPVADLLTAPEIIIVPDRSLHRVPFAALRDQPGGKYLSETVRIRFVPSLTTVRLIQDIPADYHSQTGALVVGDPKVGVVLYKGSPINVDKEPLPCARKEAEMVGRLLGVQPLLGERATKQAVLQAITSVSLIHFAAHGNAERGEICLSPNHATDNIPQEEDYLLTMSDISKVQLRAKLVVLSCCHSGRGGIKQEGVIGIARAILGSGARSVLVALWIIEDTATEQLMSRFYEHLVGGESASESLHKAMKWLRSNGFPKVCQWAPFMLIGDNVTFDFKNPR